MSTKMKLVASFGAIVLFNICFGLYCIRSLAVLNGRVVEANEWTLGASEVADMHLCVSSVRICDLSYTRATKPDLRRQILASKSDAVNKAISLFEAYRQDVMILSYDSEELREQDLKGIDSIIENWKAYETVSEKIVAVTDAETGDEELNEILGTSLPVYQALEDSVISLVKYNVEGGAEAGELSSKIYAETRLVVTTLLVLASAFSIYITIKLTRGIRRSINELLKVSESLRNCNFKVSAKVFLDDEFGMLANSYNLIIDNFKELISDIQGSAKLLATSANDLNVNVSKSSEETNIIVKKIDNVSAQAKNQRNEIELMTNTINNLSVNITDTAALLDSLTSSASESLEKAKEGGLSIKKAMAHMDMIEETVNTSAAVVGALGERSDEIGRIVETISGISSQTNLLALNAAIEAARAGAQGKGFAVVADEVKNLAGESRAAAEEISKLIASIQAETSKAVESMNDGREIVRTGTEAVRASGRAFKELADTSVKSHEQLEGVTDTMHNMSSQTSDIVSLTRNVESSGQKITESSLLVMAATQEQATAEAEISEASNNLTQIAQEMLASIQQFKI